MEAGLAPCIQAQESGEAGNSYFSRSTSSGQKQREKYSNSKRNLISASIQGAIPAAIFVSKLYSGLPLQIFILSSLFSLRRFFPRCQFKFPSPDAHECRAIVKSLFSREHSASAEVERI